ncbi:MAG TPA: hypothetical protein VMX79_03495 [bacterium]|nr:hypothetical protein [bacterium]
MKKAFVFLGVVILLIIAFGCAKKKVEAPGTSETAGVTDIAKFDEGYAGLREAIRYTSLTPNKGKAAEAAGRSEEAFGEVKRAWPEEPPEEFQGDTEWGDHIASLTKIMGDIKNQVGADQFEEARVSALEAQKIILALHEKNNVNTAGDEAVRLLVISYEMDLAFREKRFNDMKHIMPSMREAQKNFFGSTMPPSARGREAEFDDLKDKAYDGVENFADAPDPETRWAALDGLIKTTTEFYVEFG